MSLIYDTLLRILVEQFSFFRYARVSVAFDLEGVQRLLAACSDWNLGEVYIIGFLKMCRLLWYKNWGDSGCKQKIKA